MHAPREVHLRTRIAEHEVLDEPSRDGRRDLFIAELVIGQAMQRRPSAVDERRRFVRMLQIRVLDRLVIDALDLQASAAVVARRRPAMVCDWDTTIAARQATAFVADGNRRVDKGATRRGARGPFERDERDWK